MKTRIFLLPLILVALLCSCERNKDKNSGPVKNTHRIKQALYDYNEENDWKSVFTYDGEQLIMIVNYEDDGDGWAESDKLEITYNDPDFTLTWYTKESGSWELYSRSEYAVENGLLAEEFYYRYEDGEWVENWKWTYEYSGTDIIEWMGYFDNDDDGSVELDSKGEYLYEENRLVEYKAYYKDDSDDWVQYDKETFQYSGLILSGWIDFEQDEFDDWVEEYKCEYLYSGNLISEAVYYNWDYESDDWEAEPYTVTYGYDVNGYMIERMNDSEDQFTYEYEQGHGNAAFFWYYPEELVYGEPALKSTEAKKKYVPYYERIRHTSHIYN